jgi:hypothetical protein
MVNHSTNTNKMKNHLSPQATEHKNKLHSILPWKPGPCLGQTQKCGGVKPLFSYKVMTN